MKKSICEVLKESGVIDPYFEILGQHLSKIIGMKAVVDWDSRESCLASMRVAVKRELRKSIPNEKVDETCLLIVSIAVAQFKAYPGLSIDPHACMEIEDKPSNELQVGISFNLLNQSMTVQRLLDAAMAAIPLCGNVAVRIQLEGAIRQFERAVCPTAFSLNDIENDIESDGVELTDQHRCEILDRFSRKYTNTDSDWDRLYYAKAAYLEECLSKEVSDA